MKRIIGVIVTIAILGGLAWGGLALYRHYNSPKEKLSFQTERYTS